MNNLFKNFSPFGILILIAILLIGIFSTAQTIILNPDYEMMKYCIEHDHNWYDKSCVKGDTYELYE